MNSEEITLEILKEFDPNIDRTEFEKIFHTNVYDHKLMKHIVENHRPKLQELFMEKTTHEHFFPFAKDLIEELSKQYQLFIVSGADTKSLVSHLKLIESETKFVKIFGADEILSKVERFKLIFNSFFIMII